MITIDQLAKSYGALTIFADLSLHIEAGRFAAIKGASGCGKSTLLLIAGGLLSPDRGTVTIDGQSVHELGEAQRNRFRATTLGFVFQRFHLVPYLSVADNIRVAGAAAGIDDTPRLQDLLTRFGLEHRREHEPGRLSVGEQQRCALARALYCEPKVLLADEPTGNLDPDNATLVLDTFRAFADEGGSVLMVTHDPQAAARADERHALRDGRLDKDD